MGKCRYGPREKDDSKKRALVLYKLDARRSAGRRLIRYIQQDPLRRSYQRRISSVFQYGYVIYDWAVGEYKLDAAKVPNDGENLIELVDKINTPTRSVREVPRECRRRCARRYHVLNHDGRCTGGLLTPPDKLPLLMLTASTDCVDTDSVNIKLHWKRSIAARNLLQLLSKQRSGPGVRDRTVIHYYRRGYYGLRFKFFDSDPDTGQRDTARHRMFNRSVLIHWFAPKWTVAEQRAAAQRQLSQILGRLVTYIKTHKDVIRSLKSVEKKAQGTYLNIILEMINKMKTSEGMTVRYLNSGNVMKFKDSLVPVPPVEHQGRMVGVGGVELAHFGLAPDFRARDYSTLIERTVGIYFGGKARGIPDTFVTVKFRPTKTHECARDFDIIDEIVCARDLRSLAYRIDALVWEMYDGLKRINFLCFERGGMSAPSDNLNALSDFLKGCIDKDDRNYDPKSLYACFTPLIDQIRSKF
jgi:hypothetical protein